MCERRSVLLGVLCCLCRFVEFRSVICKGWKGWLFLGMWVSAQSWLLVVRGGEGRRGWASEGKFIPSLVCVCLLSFWVLACWWVQAFLLTVVCVLLWFVGGGGAWSKFGGRAGGSVCVCGKLLELNVLGYKV